MSCEAVCETDHITPLGGSLLVLVVDLVGRGQGGGSALRATSVHWMTLLAVPAAAVR